MKKLKDNKILDNIIWLLFDKVFILVLQFLVGVKIANFYGSSLYGEYTYAMTIIAFSPILLELMNGRVVKKYFLKYKFNDVVSTQSTFKNIMAILIFLFVALSRAFIKLDNQFYLILLLISFDNILITLTSGIESYFEYELKSKYIVVSNNIIKSISYGLQYIGLILSYSIIMLPIIRCIGSLIRCYILKRAYKKIFKEKEKIYINKTMLINIISESKYLWLSFISFVIYSQLDRVMIGNMLGDSEVGIYSIALQLVGFLSILIGPIQNSVFPKLLNLYENNKDEYYKFYLKINIGITQLYILAVISSIFVVKFLFPYVYSKEYTGAISVYNILAITVLFKANASLQTGHIILKKMTRQIIYKTLCGLFINIILNLLLIRLYGIKGAAIATLITHVITVFIMDFFIKEYREHFFIQLKSFNPFNLIKK